MNPVEDRDNPASSSYPTTGRGNDKARIDHKVIMYCTPWCPDYVLAHIWLKEHGIAYIEVDISSDLDAARQVRSWGEGAQVTPTFDIDGQIILDFDPSLLEKLLLV